MTGLSILFIFIGLFLLIAFRDELVGTRYPKRKPSDERTAWILDNYEAVKERHKQKYAKRKGVSKDLDDN